MLDSFDDLMLVQVVVKLEKKQVWVRRVID